MSTALRNLQLISDFNVKPLAQFLAATNDSFEVDVAPFAQVYQSLDMPPASTDETAVVWTLPERIIPSFARAMSLEKVCHESCLAETRDFAKAVLTFARKRRYVFVSSWALPSDHRGYGVLDWMPQIGLSNLIARMNLCLADELSKAPNVHILDVTRWLGSGTGITPPKMWYAAKVPFSNAVFERAAKDCLSAMRAVKGQSRKLIVVDLDNTLWGGVIGETGWQGVRLGGHDHVGEAFKDFQSSLLALSNRGIQLAIVSKNDETVAIEAIDLHPEMVLKRRHFAGWRINWSDKAANITSLVQELNFGLSAVVFIDDNPVERDRVAAALPDVMVPEWPIDPTAYVTALRKLDCFDVAVLTNEDRNRTAMYAAERDRRTVMLVADSADTWLSKLDTHLRIARIDSSNIARVAQLFNKTNQLNLSTRRLPDSEILAWSNAPKRSMIAVSATDKFGEMGLVGVVSVEVDACHGRLVDFILSCRVMGRKVEDAMLHVAAAEAARLGGTSLVAQYLPTARNRPTLDVFRDFKLTEKDNQLFFAGSLDHFTVPNEVVVDYGMGNIRSVHNALVRLDCSVKTSDKVHELDANSWRAARCLVGRASLLSTRQCCHLLIPFARWRGEERSFAFRLGGGIRSHQRKCYLVEKSPKNKPNRAWRRQAK